MLDAISTAVHDLKAQPAVDLQPVLDAIATAVHDLKAEPAVDLQPVLDAVATRASAADVVHVMPDSVTVQLDAKALMGAISTMQPAAQGS